MVSSSLISPSVGDVERSVAGRGGFGQLFVVEIAIRSHDQNGATRLIVWRWGRESAIAHLARGKDEGVDRTDRIDAEIVDLDEIGGEQRQWSLMPIGPPLRTADV